MSEELITCDGVGKAWDRRHNSSYRTTHKEMIPDIDLFGEPIAMSPHQQSHQ
jgi:hypothetical protein